MEISTLISLCCLLKLLKGSGRQDGLKEVVGGLDGQSGKIFSSAVKLVRREEPLHEDKMAKREENV